MQWLKKRILKLQELISRFRAKRKIAYKTIAISAIGILPNVSNGQNFDLITSHPFINVYSESASPCFVDFDKDGDLDIFLFGDGDMDVLYYENNDGQYDLDENFSLEKNNETGDIYGTVADFDGDGDMDVFIGSDMKVDYIRNDGGTLKVVDDSENPMFGLATADNSKPLAGDIDNDGDIDLIVSSTAGVTTFINNGGVLSEGMTLSGGDLSDSSSALADVDGDGDLDLLVGNKYGDLFYFENVAGTYGIDANPFENIEYNAYQDLAVIDFDKDGDLDVVTNTSAGSINLQLNDGDFQFETINYNEIGIEAPDLTSVPTFYDFDKDGDDDLLIGTVDDLYYYENNDGSFDLVSNSPFKDIIGDYNDIDPVFLDFDADGDADLVVGEYSQIVLFENQDGNFVDITLDAKNPFSGVGQGENYLSPAFVDLDLDGDLDLVLGNKYGTIDCYVNDNGVYSELSNHPFDNFDRGSFSKPTVYDYDFDGDDDVIIGSNTGDLYVFNFDNDTFVELSDIDNPFHGLTLRSNSAIDFYDFDGDSKPDALVGSAASALLHLKNNLIVSNTNEKSVFNQQTIVFPSPTSDYLKIEAKWTEGDYHIFIFDILGNLVKNTFVEGDSHTLDLSDLESGSFLLVIESEEGKSQNRIIKN